jgi:hypothetical protein
MAVREAIRRTKPSWNICPDPKGIEIAQGIALFENCSEKRTFIP